MNPLLLLLPLLANAPNINWATSPALEFCLHDGIHERIAAAAARIAADPSNPALYVFRASLYREHQDWPEAHADLKKARQLAPANTGLLLEEAHYFRARGQRLAALQNLESLTTQAKSEIDSQIHAAAWVLRAHILRDLKQTQAAADAMAKAIPLQVKAEPDHFHFQAHCLQQLGFQGLKPALECARRGIQTLGACISLELLAVELETKLGRCEDAIQRLTRLSHQARRKESWYMKMGDVYWRSGQRAEACKKYRAALAAIQRLRPRTQNTPAVKEMSRRAQSQLAMLAP